MTDLISSGRLIDLILALMVAEVVALWAYRARTGQGPAAIDVAILLVAGGSLMLAVRAALVGAAPHWIAVCLTVSLLAHLADLGRRWRAGNDMTFRTPAMGPFRHVEVDK